MEKSSCIGKGKVSKSITVPVHSTFTVLQIRRQRIERQTQIRYRILSHSQLFDTCIQLNFIAAIRCLATIQGNEQSNVIGKFPETNLCRQFTNTLNRRHGDSDVVNYVCTCRQAPIPRPRSSYGKRHTELHHELP